MINRLKNKAEKYWIVYYFDDDRKTFNPGVLVSIWDVVQNIERITYMLQKEGRKVKICTTLVAHSINDLLSQEDYIKAGPQEYSYDPFLMW